MIFYTFLHHQTIRAMDNMIRCMLVKWSGITASKSDVFVWQKAPKGTLNPPVFGDLWPFPMMSVVDIPLSMLISLLPNQKT
jgi:hypothetical protein